MSATTIVALEVHVLDLPLVEPFSIATGTQEVAANALVRVVLEDGITGIGEAAPVPHISGEDRADAIAAIGHVRPLVVGEDVRRWRWLAERLGRAIPDAHAARCAVEMALVDALTRHHRLPAWAFFGGRTSTLATDMTITAGDREHAITSARSIAARGIKTIKVKTAATDPEEDVARLVGIRRAVPSARLLVDANGGWDHAAAERFLAGLDAQGVVIELLEQPFARDDVQAWKSLSRKTTVPLCADESARSASDVLEIINGGWARAINIKLMKCGITEALAMWHLARAGGLDLMIGGMVESILAMSFSACFASGLGGFRFVDLDTPSWIRKHPFVGGFQQHGETIDLGHVAAGHGVELSAASATALARVADS